MQLLHLGWHYWCSTYWWEHSGLLRLQMLGSGTLLSLDPTLEKWSIPTLGALELSPVIQLKCYCVINGVALWRQLLSPNWPLRGFADSSKTMLVLDEWRWITFPFLFVSTFKTQGGNSNPVLHPQNLVKINTLKGWKKLSDNYCQQISAMEREGLGFYKGFWIIFDK